MFNGHHWRRDTGIHFIIFLFLYIEVCKFVEVTGEANFVMASTRLTVGGFTQPGVARNLMDMASNAEKGLSQKFLWVFPRHICRNFNALEKVDKDFQRKLGKL